MNLRALIPLVIGIAIFTPTNTKGEQKVPPNVRAIIEKTQSFGLRRYPISF